MRVTSINDVFSKGSGISLSAYKKYVGSDATEISLLAILTDFALSFNTGQNLKSSQLQDLVIDIMEYYYFLTLEDLKVCFKNAQRGIYGDIYRIDAAVILTWLEKYSNDRLNRADEISYNSHVSTKDESRGEIKNAANIYKKFKA